MAAKTLPTTQALSNITLYDISPQKANNIVPQFISKLYGANQSTMIAKR
jgi:DNA polymerase IIIc chi subunit